MGVRTGVSFGPSDFRQQSRKGTGSATQRPTLSPIGNEQISGSFVYVIRGDHNMVKIGVSTNPSARLAHLKTASAFPLSFAFIGATHGSGFDIEAEAHKLLTPHRCAGEWFDIPCELAISAVMGAAGKLGQPVQILTQEQADQVLKLAAMNGEANPLGNTPPAVRLGASGWFAVSGMTLLIILAAFLCVAIVSGVSGAKPNETLMDALVWAFIGISLCAPFLSYRLVYDRNLRRSGSR